MNKVKFTEEAWLAAGFRALTSEGPTAIRAEALARNLGATKGSFYWNFSDLPSFKRAMLAMWRDAVIEEIETTILVEPDKHKRLEILAECAAVSAPDDVGGRRLGPAMRSWALTDPLAFTVVNEVDQLRLELITRLLREIGLNDPVLCQLVYGAYIGLDDLTSMGHADISCGLKSLLKMISNIQAT